MSPAKARWSARADARLGWANAAERRADALTASHCTDWAFVSQPGHIPARARQIAQTDRAMELRAKATEHRQKATELQRLATTTKGDAATARQAVRDAKAFKAGDPARSIHYGACTIVKVNAKTCRIRLASGYETTQDKAYLT